MRRTCLACGWVEGDRGRTIGQLRLFAALVREGSWMEGRIDKAVPDRQPMPPSDLRRRHIPPGPVAVFGASDFPLAFRLLAARPLPLRLLMALVAKTHQAHPGTSEFVGRAIQATVQRCGLAKGVS